MLIFIPDKEVSHPCFILHLKRVIGSLVLQEPGKIRWTRPGKEPRVIGKSSLGNCPSQEHKWISDYTGQRQAFHREQVSVLVSSWTQLNPNILPWSAYLSSCFSAPGLQQLELLNCSWFPPFFIYSIICSLIFSSISPPMFLLEIPSEKM